jgi:beta-lysine 5,6-aminomutase beta subunit
MPAVKPYGDHPGDGLVCVQFTLPTSSREAAKGIATLMDLHDPEVLHAQPLTGEHTHFTIYGKLKKELTHWPEEPDPQWLEKDRIEELAQSLGVKIIVVGAATGTDTHDVGLNAILQLKGWDGHKGLEAYDCFEVHNLGSQVPNEDLHEKARELGADVVLISQTVTQQGLHEQNLRDFLDTERHGILSYAFQAVGGPQVTNKFARELGFDAGFGRGTLPEHVATAIVRAMLERRTDLVQAAARAAHTG